MDELIDQKRNSDSNNFSAKVKVEPELTIVDDLRLILVINMKLDIAYESKTYIYTP